MTDITLSPEQLEREQRLAWFKAARFGMFIHWGLYAQLGRNEWAMNLERIPVAEYERLAATWKPAPGCIRQWAKLAKQAGMRYMVLTTKHHEGFCLFDSKLTDYTAVQQGPERDLIAEYVEAARAEGLRVGFYYSLMDWHHPDGANCARDEDARRRFIDYIHGQVRELCTNYGKVDIMWYDVSWPLDAEGWESAKLNAMVRELQPGIIINDRSQLPEDFGTPEQHITAAEPGRAWEACMTFNDASWGYTPYDNNYKSAWQVVNMLRQVASGGGNLLLNISPRPDGGVPGQIEQILGEVGGWMQQYGASIYDATDPMKQDFSFHGAYTRKGNIAYYHINRWTGSEITIGGFITPVQAVRFLHGAAIEFEQKGEQLILRGLPTVAPNAIDTVIELHCDGEPRHRIGFSPVVLNEDNPWAFPAVQRENEAK